MAYISVIESARRLGRSIEQVRRYLREGKLRGQRIGGHWFVDEDAVVGLQAASREAGRVSEPAATYGVKPMKATKSNKKFKTLLDPKLMDDIEETARRIEAYAGPIDVVALIREIREEH